MKTWQIILLCTILCILLFLALLTVIRVLEVRNMEQENRLMRAYTDSMMEFYTGIQERIEATRRYRHDLAKHIHTLEYMLEKQQSTADIQDYMDELKTHYDNLKRHEFCRDELVDSILSIKKKECLENGIPIQIEAEDHIYNELREVDLVSLIYNLLDNAIEENERIRPEDPHGIRFFLGKEQGMIRLRITNALRPGKIPTFQSDKAQTEEHGIGTRIIGDLIARYHGTQTLHVDQERWILEDDILLRPVPDTPSPSLREEQE